MSLIGSSFSAFLFFRNEEEGKGLILLLGAYSLWGGCTAVFSFVSLFRDSPPDRYYF
jgi:hypothetical protein